jgi:hypothetical protein
MASRRRGFRYAEQEPIALHPCYASWRIDYDRLVAHAGEPSRVAVFLQDELPYEWMRVYETRSPQRANLHRIAFHSGEYVFDLITPLVQQGRVAAKNSVDDRIVAVHGRARPATTARQDGILRGHTRSAADVLPTLRADGYDRGHFFAHTLGGALYVNIFPQLRCVNRGWSPEGKRFRAMEAYALTHRSYCFARPIYAGYSYHPAVLEYGLLRDDMTLWVDAFPNLRRPKDAALIENALRQKRETPL